MPSSAGANAGVKAKVPEAMMRAGPLSQASAGNNSLAPAFSSNSSPAHFLGIEVASLANSSALSFEEAGNSSNNSMANSTLVAMGGQENAVLFGENRPMAVTNDCFFHPTMQNYVMILTFSIIFCLSVVGNSIVVVVILQQRSMRSVTNLYLLNLALSDLLLSVVCMPPTLVSSLVYCWVFGDLLCKLLAYLQPVVVTASAYTLAAIALERYYAICRPLHSRVWHTRRHAMFVISLVWLVSVIANVSILFMYEERPYNVNGLNCSPKFEPYVHFGYQIYMTIVLLLIPLFTMTVLYGNVIKTLHTGIKMDIAALEPLESDKTPTASQKSSGKKMPLWKQASTATVCGEQGIRSTHSGQSAIVKQRLIRMLIVIVVVFFCCWTPSYIWWLLLMAQDTFGTFNIWNSELNTLITVLTYLSSCTNPITYCFLNNKFRNALCLTFGCRRPGGQGSNRSNFQRALQLSQIDSPPREGSIGSDRNNNSHGNGAERGKKNQNCCLQMLRSTKTILSTPSKSGQGSKKDKNNASQ